MCSCDSVTSVAAALSGAIPGAAGQGDVNPCLADGMWLDGQGGKPDGKT